MKKDINPYELAKISYEIEKNKLNETVGIQDQIATSFGGFNSVDINKDGTYQISPVNLSTLGLKSFMDRLILVNTGQTRRASEIATKQIENIKNKKNEYLILQNMVAAAKNYLSNNEIDKFGLLMHEAWDIKRNLSSAVSNKNINDLYDFGIKNGVLGGKVLGAGGGGFLLFVCKEGIRDNLVGKLNLNNIKVFPFNISTTGTKIIYSEEPR